MRIAGENVCVSMAEQLLTPSQQVTSSIPGNDVVFFSKIFLHACASTASAAYCMHACYTIACMHAV